MIAACGQRVALIGIGSHVPERVMSNDEIATMVETSDEWIAQRTGIRERRIAAASDSSATLGAEAARLPNTTLFSVPGMKAETAVIAFDLEGVAVSSGSACSSGKVAPSHVLAAMGVAPELARGAIRVSLGHTTSGEDVGTILKAWEKLSESLYKAGNQQEIAA